MTKLEIGFDVSQEGLDGIQDQQVMDHYFYIRRGRGCPQISTTITITADGIMIAQSFFIDRHNGNESVCTLTIPDNLQVEVM